MGLVQHSHLLVEEGFLCFINEAVAAVVSSSNRGCSSFRFPALFKFLALSKITENSVAAPGLFTSHSPNFGNGTLLSVDIFRRAKRAKRCSHTSSLFHPDCQPSFIFYLFFCFSPFFNHQRICVNSSNNSVNAGESSVRV